MFPTFFAIATVPILFLFVPFRLDTIHFGRFTEKSVLYQTQLANVPIDFWFRDSKSMTPDTCGAKQPKHLAEKNRMIDWCRQRNMANMTRAVFATKIAGG